jgi:TonB-dependent Receptor Plug Domain/CarboxypepD_reg-like domain
MKKLTIFIVCFFIATIVCHSTIYGQVKKENISIKATNQPFLWLANQIESQTNYTFYFNRTDIDSVFVSGDFTNSSIKELLDKILYNKGLYFSIDAQNNVYITKLFKISTNLPSQFFSGKANSLDSLPNNFIVATDSLKSNTKKVIENKLYEIGIRNNLSSKGKAILSGYIRDSKNGEAISGAAISTDSPYTSVNSDQYGYFSITLPKGYNTIKAVTLGMKEAKRLLIVYSDGRLNIDMEETVATLKPVTVSAEKRSNIRSTQMGVERISAKALKQIPAVLGEADLLRAVLSLPGVTSVGEASTGFNVRGGATDQNLILFNDATIFNPSHLFGFFSAFNADMIKGAELYKSGIPAKYGGRLSSVLDVTGREGSNKKITTTGGIGLLTGRLTIEGPVNKEGSTFIVSARTTYSDWLLKRIPNDSYENSNASFYDLSGSFSHKINANNSLVLSGYISKDRFKLNSDTAYSYGNKNIVLKWKHIFNNQLSGVLTTGIDDYRFSIGSNKVPINAYTLSYRINQTHGRYELNYNPNNQHSIVTGIHSIYYKIRPGSFQPALPESLVQPDEVGSQQAIETAFYFSDKYNVNDRLSINAGFRYSLYSFLGPQEVALYKEGLPRNSNTRINSIFYNSGSNIKTYHGPEIRLDARYTINANQSVKFSFNTLRQYLHTLSNTAAISPTDVLQLSNTYIKPQIGYQFALGYYKNIGSKNLETSIEVYYKGMQNYLDFKSGATLLLNKSVETDIISTRGRAYGAELMVKKTAGKLSGWFSYTFSRVLLQQNDDLAGEQINKGNYYPANFDRPHNINLVSNYKFSHRLSLSFTGVFASGRPITLPIAFFNQGGGQRVLYSERNEYRIKDYIRADVSLNIDGNHKIKKLAHSSWSVGIYNLTARANPYSVFFQAENGEIKGYELSIFATAIPFITYNFKF